ncbi:hypothetical protein PR202_gb26677 [Eleusine coracana subsp. coracana]|uniref:Protein decapping 5 n=1 Tax=Eleusine coracana subsp. coracana TaxID=191504 RepID=A0AAV5FTW2_ELECO|nr:hypothetical protein PR202_gb26677 [Eleusine coracana subsp. coracana]
MAAEAPPSSSASSAARPAAASGSGSGGGAASPESYIGSVISLTSKSEIRYEGILYNINTEESSIGLRNVRSFGTEGRKKDGMQIPASDKVYEYILFRGSDIKDLQVKSSPPPPQPASLHNDPAIIQSHYSQPASASSSLPTAGGAVLPDLSSQAAQYGLQRPSFQSNLPLYQPGSAPWGSPAAAPGGSASTLSVPSMYWQGYYAPSSGLPPHMQQPPLLQPGSGLSVPQNLQYPGFNPSLPSGLQKLSELQPSLMQPPVSSQGPSSVLPASTAPVAATFSAPENSKPLLPNMGPLFTPPVTSLGATSPFASHLTSMAETSATMTQNLTSLGGSRAAALPGSALTYQTVSQSVSSAVPPSSSAQVEVHVPLLTQSGQLLQNTASVLPSSLSMEAPLQMGNKEVKPVEPKAKVTESLLPDPLLPDPPSRALPENREPILPLPKQAPQKFSQSVTSFTEEFDFTAMNEKFNKDEVWGHLGKKSQSRDRDGELGNDVFDEDLEVEETGNPELDAKPVYVKDDFFDSLSSGTFGRGGPNGRGRFSERRRVDTETFGDFPRHRQPYRGGARGYHGGGGGRSRGSYYGGGGRGYGNMGMGAPGNGYPHRGYGRD